MSSVPSSSLRCSVAEYLRIEAEASERHEFRDGEVLAMAGGSPTHSLIIANVIREIGNRVKGTPCRVFDANLRVRIARTTRYSYPDATVVCGEPQFDPEDVNRQTVTNPRVVFEVLSDSTEQSDRGEKFERYIVLPSLEEYVLVSQRRRRIDTYWRQQDGTWSLAFYDGLDAVARIRSLSLHIPLADIYLGVEFLPGNEDS